MELDGPKLGGMRFSYVGGILIMEWNRIGWKRFPLILL